MAEDPVVNSSLTAKQRGAISAPCPFSISGLLTGGGCSRIPLFALFQPLFQFLDTVVQLPNHGEHCRPQHPNGNAGQGRRNCAPRLWARESHRGHREEKSHARGKNRDQKDRKNLRDLSPHGFAPLQQFVTVWRSRELA